LEIPEAGISLALDRGASTQTETAAPKALADDGDVVVTAPVLGTFYRRRSPEKPPLVNVGDHVAAGALVGLIEVMKTYYDVTAPVAGTVSRLLAEDGHYVEYGAPLVHLSPER
jgi:acetyl-CoA carboxylase biotin carboxyl carrier protein